jgi:hypothetical protein
MYGSRLGTRKYYVKDQKRAILAVVGSAPELQRALEEW